MLKEIETRQSIRKFKDIPVTDEQIEILLQAAMNAPTARNKQTWRFIVVTDRKTLDHFPELSPFMKMMETAPCAIIVLGDKSLVNETEYLYYDGSAAIENILIEAVHLGLGTCWCAIAPSEERINSFTEYFKLDDSLIPLSAIAVGVSDEEKPLVDRYDPNKVTYIK